MNDNTLTIGVEVSDAVANTRQLTSAMVELEKAVQRLPASALGNLKAEVAGVSTAMKSLAMSMETSLNSIAKSMEASMAVAASEAKRGGKKVRDALEQGLNDGPSTKSFSRVLREDMQQQYDSMLRDQKTFSVESLREWKNMGTSLSPAHRKILADAAAFSGQLQAVYLQAELSSQVMRTKTLATGVNADGKVQLTSSAGNRVFGRNTAEAAAVSDLTEGTADLRYLASPATIRALQKFVTDLSLEGERVKAAYAKVYAASAEGSAAVLALYRGQYAEESRLASVREKIVSTKARLQQEELAQSQRSAQVQAAYLASAEGHAAAQARLKGQYDEEIRLLAVREKIVSTKARLQQEELAQSARQKAYLASNQGSAAALTSMRDFYLSQPTAKSSYTSTSFDAKAAADAHTSTAAAAAKSASAADGLNESHRRLSGSSRELHSVMRGLSASLGGLFLTYGSIIPLASAFFAASAVKNAISEYANLELQIKMARAVADDFSLSQQTLAKGITDVAVNFGVAPVEAAKAFRGLAQAGLDSADALRALPTVLAVSVAGELSAKTATDALAGSMNAFGLSVSSLSRIGDVFVRAGALSSTSVEQISESMKVAATIAQQYRLSVEDVGTALTLLAKRNITGSSAGTSLVNMFNELAVPSGEAKKVAQQLKLTLFDPASGDVKDFYGKFLPELRAKISNYTLESQTVILNKLTNNRGAKLLSALMGVTQEDVTKTLAELSDATGAAARVVVEKNDSVIGDLDRLKAAYASASATAGESVSGSMRQVLQDLKAFVESDTFAALLRGLTGLLGALVGIASATTTALETVYTSLSRLSDNFGGGASGALAVVSALGALVAVSVGLAARLGAVAAASSLLSTGFVGVAGASTAAATGVTVLAGVAARLLVFTGVGAAIALAAWAISEFYAAATKKSDIDLAVEGADRMLRKELELEKSIRDQLNLMLQRKGLQAEKRSADTAKREGERDEAYGAFQAQGGEEKLAEYERKRLAIQAGVDSGRLSPHLLDKEYGDVIKTSKVFKTKEKLERDIAASEARRLSDTARIKAENDADQAAANKRLRDTVGTVNFKLDDKPGPAAHALKDYHDNELEQIKARNASEMSVLKQAQEDRQKLLNADRDATIIGMGKYQMLELALVTAGERDKIEELRRAGSESRAEFDNRVKSLDDEYAKALKDSAGKKNEDALDEESLKRYTVLVNNLINAEQTRQEKLDDEILKAERSATTIRTVQLKALQGEIRKTQEATDDFWRSERERIGQGSRADATDDLLRYASPEARARISAVASETERLTALVVAQDHAITKLQKSKAEYDEITGPRTEAESQREQALNDILDDRIKKRDQLKGTVAESAEREGARALKKYEKDHVAELSRSTAEAIVTGLTDGGASGAVKLREIIVAELRKPVVLLVQALISPIMGALTGGGGGGAGGLGSLGKLFNGGSFNPLDSLLNSGGSLGGLFSSAGAYGSAVGAGAATGVGSQAAMLAAQTGEFGVAGLAATAEAAGAAATGLSSLSAGLAAIPGWGWAAMGALALFGGSGLFGGSKEEVKSTGISGKFGPQGFAGQNFSKWERRGGLFESSSSGNNLSAMDATQAKGLGDAFLALRTQSVGFAEALGLSSAGIKSFTKDIELALGGDKEANQRVVEAAMQTLGNDLAKQALGTTTRTSRSVTEDQGMYGSGGDNGLGEWISNVQTRVVEEVTYTASEFARAGEAAFDTLKRLGGSLMATNSVLGTLGLKLYAVSLAGGDAASKLADATGGLEAFAAKTANYYDKFYSDEEKVANARQAATLALAKAGLGALPASREAYRKLVQAQDLSTDAGRAHFAVLMDTATAFDQVATAAEQTSTAVKNMVDNLLDEVRRIRGEVAGTGTQGFAYAQAQFVIGNAKAQAGDQAAMKLLPELSRTMLTLAEGNATSLIELRRIQAGAASALTGTVAALTRGAGGGAAASAVVTPQTTQSLAAALSRVVSGGLFGAAFSVPSFDVGTDYVPQDMLAMVHKGERITPAPFNNNNGNAELVAEIRALRQEVVALRASSSETASAAKETAGILQGATRGGLPLQTKATA